MLLINLPSELIILISEFLKTKELNALVQTSSRFANLLCLHLLDRGLADPKLEILLWAAAEGNEEGIQKILGRAQDKQINIPPQIKDTMLMAAVWHKRVDLLEYVVRTVGANLSAVVPCQMPNSLIYLMPRAALHTAAAQGNKVTTRKLIELEADVNAMDFEGRSALHYAVGDIVYEEPSADGESQYSVNMTAVLALLLKHGARTEVKSLHLGQTPLLCASINGNTEAIRVLLDHGADINASDNEGCTALHFAAESGNHEAIRELLGLGADITASDIEGWTALHCAAHCGNHEAVKLLVEKGADTFAISHNADTPLDVSDSELVREILRKAGAPTGPELRLLQRRLLQRLLEF
jgi:hypothetical protein